MLRRVVPEGRRLFIGALALLPLGGEKEVASSHSLLEPSGQKRAMEFPADSSAETVTGPVPASLGATSRLWRLSNFVMAVFFGLAGAVQVGAALWCWVDLIATLIMVVIVICRFKDVAVSHRITGIVFLKKGMVPVCLESGLGQVLEQEALYLSKGKANGQASFLCKC